MAAKTVGMLALVSWCAMVAVAGRLIAVWYVSWRWSDPSIGPIIPRLPVHIAFLEQGLAWVAGCHLLKVLVIVTAALSVAAHRLGPAAGAGDALRARPAIRRAVSVGGAVRRAGRR